ncbi:MAG: ribosome biogenesis GTPase Der [Spirochaetes bacterium]|nr:ribosome biogenesis GTPase Der [Spirochaetota bacterium]
MTKKLPVVTIVGRQNVGKSTLFNALSKEKRAIVDSIPGLTRDIISFNITHGEKSFILSDTPGLDITDSSELSQSILQNALDYFKKSSLIIFLLENPDLLPFDYKLYEIIRKTSLPTIVAVNKMDSNSDLENMSYFYELGCSDILPISALRRVNIKLLIDKILDLLPEKSRTPDADVKISIVGRPNSGKSTLLNSIIGENRAVVSDVPGTTRDSVDEDFYFHGKRIKIIDTAGLKKKSKITKNVDFFSKTRTIESIRKSDVVIHLMDAQMGITETDKKICDEILKVNKPLIIGLNKWDIIDKDTKTFEEYKDKVIFKLYRTADFPIISLSAKEKLRIHKLLQTAVALSEKARVRIETAKLNKIIESVQARKQLPLLGDKLKIYYATQIETVPPRFKFFVNNSALFRKEVIRFFQKLLQKELDIKGIPILINLQDRDSRNKKKK